MAFLADIYETHMEVSDLEAAVAFYGDTLGLELGTVDDRGIAFFWVGEPSEQRSMLGLWESQDVSPGHFAFRVDEAAVDELEAFLAERGIPPVEALGIAPADQPLVHPWIPAAAIYFEDPDGNQLELLAVLSDEPRPDLDPLSLSEWRGLTA